MGSVKRSPKCPFIDLGTAIEKARAFYRGCGRNPVTVSDAVARWGYGPKSSGGLQTLAALKGYGLLTDQGTSKGRRVQLTKLALRILLDERVDSRERREAIREAALTPQLFAELSRKWKDQGLSSPTDLRHFLVLEKAFNENSAEEFARKFIDTLRFAQLDGDGTTDSPQSLERIAAKLKPGPTHPPAPVYAPTALTHSLSESTAAPVPHGRKQDVFTVEEGEIVLLWPESLSPESLEDFENWLQLVLRKIKRSVKRAARDWWRSRARGGRL